MFSFVMLVRLWVDTSTYCLSGGHPQIQVTPLWLRTNNHRHALSLLRLPVTLCSLSPGTQMWYLYLQQFAFLLQKDTKHSRVNGEITSLTYMAESPPHVQTKYILLQNQVSTFKFNLKVRTKFNFDTSQILRYLGLSLGVKLMKHFEAL